MKNLRRLPREQGWEDPIFAAHSLPYRKMFFPLGFPLEIETNSEHILKAASDSWSAFGQEFDEEPILLSIGVSQGVEEILPPPPVVRSRRHLLSIVSDPNNFVSCDLGRGYGFGWVNQTLAEETGYFRYYFLDVAAMTVIQQRFLAPLHGACVVRNGRGVLLCGTSGAGKSTLAYACSRAGWTYVSDDATFLVRSRADGSAIGNCHSIRLRESSKRFFPELFHLTPSRRPNGTQRIETSTRELSIATAFTTKISHVVFLDRNEPGTARLVPGSGEEALEWFMSFACYGEDGVLQAQRASTQKIVEGDVWHLSYQSLEEAIALLDHLIDQDQLQSA